MYICGFESHLGQLILFCEKWVISRVALFVLPLCCCMVFGVIGGFITPAFTSVPGWVTVFCCAVYWETLDMLHCFVLLFGSCYLTCLSSSAGRGLCLGSRVWLVQICLGPLIVSMRSALLVFAVLCGLLWSYYIQLCLFIIGGSLWSTVQYQTSDSLTLLTQVTAHVYKCYIHAHVYTCNVHV